MVKQYQNTKHMTVAGTITNGLVIWFSGTPSAVGASWKNDAPEVGCKPFQEKILEIGILSTSDSVFSPDSEYGSKKS